MGNQTNRPLLETVQNDYKVKAVFALSNNEIARITFYQIIENYADWRSGDVVLAVHKIFEKTPTMRFRCQDDADDAVISQPTPIMSSSVYFAKLDLGCNYSHVILESLQTFRNRLTLLYEFIFIKKTLTQTAVFAPCFLLNFENYKIERSKWLCLIFFTKKVGLFF